MQLKVKRWKPEEHLQAGKRILLVGGTGMGKSVIFKHLLYVMKDMYDLGIGFTPTDDSIKMFEDGFPLPFVFDDFNKEFLKGILETLRKITEADKPRKCLICLDDCSFDREIGKGTTFRDMCMNGRHYGAGLIHSVQYLNDVKTDIRGQFDVVIALMEPIRANRERLYKNIFGVFGNFVHFEKVFKDCTGNYESLVFQKCKTSNSIEDNIFFFKANPDIGAFRFGKEIFWKLAESYQKKPLTKHEKRKRLYNELLEGGPSEIIDVGKSVDIVKVNPY